VFPQLPHKFCLQEEDLAMIAAQQYYIEYCSDLNVDRLYNLLPSYIPDYCLASADKAIDRWGQLVVQAYKKVLYLISRNLSNWEWSVSNLTCVCM
jgi:hypothetical protein